MRTNVVFALALCACLYASQATVVKVAFFDNSRQDGNAISFEVSVSNSCTTCQGFGFRLTNSWESYQLAAPIGTGNSGNYSLTVYDGGSCSGKSATLTTLYADFPTLSGLKDSVDSWIICSPGKTPSTG